jgi:glutamate-5-semialdehyde dehydrogenase
MTSVNPANDEIIDIARAAKAASRRLALVNRAVKDRALLSMAARLEAQADEILAANAEDVAESKDLVARGKMAQALLDRLKLDKIKLAGMAAAVRAVATLDDPASRLLARTLLDDGLELHKVSCPLGVLAIIFESRPDAVTQISALALKSGNCAILKGGREATRTNCALARAITAALAEIPEIPPNVISLLTEREQANALLALDEYIDLVIPRGSNELVRYIQTHTRIPVLGHAEGICHIFIDRSANAAMAIDIVYDSKLQYPAACNAVETVLVHAGIAPTILKDLLTRLAQAGVELRACARARALAGAQPELASALTAASEADWRAEYCAPILSIKIVDSLDEAIEHINRYGSGHTDAIISEDKEAAEIFLNSIDAAGVYHNASTRFADGFRYGFGAEVGISTSKLHARGPVGLDGLVSYKYKLYGQGQLVASYCGANARDFKHQKLALD